MSCKILRGGTERPVSPMVWSTMPGPEKAGAPAPGPVAQAEKTSQSWQQIAAHDLEHDPRLREAHQKGFAEGQEAARRQLAEEARELMERVARTVAQLTEMRPRVRREAEGDLVKLSIAIARRILHRELTLDPESVQGLVRVVLEKMQSKDLSRVRIHPGQEALIRSVLQRCGIHHNIEFIADPALHPGDVIYETASGDLDASVDSQLREIERGFVDRL